MIILRQKSYSSAFTKAAARLLTPIHRGIAKGEELGLKANKHIRKVLTPGSNVIMDLEHAPKSTTIPSYQAKRQAVKLNRTLNTPQGRLELGEDIKAKAIDAGVKGARFIESAAINPGNAASAGVRLLPTQPIAALGQVGTGALNVAYPVTTAFPIGTGMIVAEQAVRSNFPKYKKATEVLGKLYDRKLHPVVSSGVNTLVNTAKVL